MHQTIQVASKDEEQMKNNEAKSMEIIEINQDYDHYNNFKLRADKVILYVICRLSQSVDLNYSILK